MTQEEKQLLLSDICARLTYGVKCQIDYNNEEDSDLGIERYCDDRIVSVCVETEEIGLYEASEYFYPDEIKPYLRPMSSMTEEEKKIMRSCGFELIPYDTGHTGFANIKNYIDEVSFRFMEEFLNAHHFDYRGLIPMGLALEAKEGMYK